MSDYLAIGGVTAVLAYLLANSPEAGGLSSVLTASPAITAVSPDMITTGSAEAGQVNLYMYYVSLNAALRNLDLPAVDAAGNRVQDIDLPDGALIISVLRGGNGFVPKADSIIEAGDQVMLILDPGLEDEITMHFAPAEPATPA